MSDSETSVNNNITYKTNNGENILDYKKQQSTDTDYYFNMIANPNKTILPNDSTTSETPVEQSLRESPHDSVHGESEHNHKYNKTERENSPSSPQRDLRQTPKSPQHTPRPVSPIPDKISNNQHIPARFTEENNSHNEPRTMTAQEVRMKKIELLRRLSEIKIKGYSLSKEYDFNSSVEEMQYEYDLLKSFAEKRNGIKIYKNVLLNVTSAIEFMNDKYDPFDFHLSGWSEHLAYDIDSYDDVLEDLYEKYKGSGKKMAPEVKLLLLIVASASAFHFTKSQTMPIQIPQNVTSGILNNVINSKKDSSQFMTEQEMNIEKLRAELKAKEKELQQPSIQPIQQLKQQPKQQTQQQIQQPKQQPIQQPKQQPQPAFEPVAANAKPHLLPPQINVPIKAPESVKDILNRLHSLQPTKVNTNPLTDTQDESANNDRLLSETTLSDSTKRKSATKTKKKANISVI
jgi:hypothetical protein